MACLHLFIDLWDTSDVFMSHNPSYVPLDSTCLQLLTTLEIIWCIFSKPKSGFKSGKPRRTSARCNLILRLTVVHCIAVPEPQWHQNIKPTWAIALSAKLMYGNEKNNLPDPTVRPVFSLYLIFFGFRKQQLLFHLSTGTQVKKKNLFCNFPAYLAFCLICFVVA